MLVPSLKKNQFFKESKDNENIYYYYSNTKLLIKILKLVIWWGIALIALYFSVVQLSVSQDFILGPIVKQALLFIPIEIILIYLGFESLALRAQRKRLQKNLLLPGIHNVKLNFVLFVLMLVSYVLLIEYYWIPSLPISIRGNVDFHWAYHFYSVVLMMVTVFCFAIGLNSALKTKRFILDRYSGWFTVKGRTLYRKKYSHIFHFEEPIQILLQPYRRVLNPTTIKQKYSHKPKLEGAKDWRIMGVFLYLTEKRYLIHISNYEQSASFANEIAEITNWKILETDEILYDIESNLEFAIN